MNSNHIHPPLESEAVKEFFSLDTEEKYRKSSCFIQFLLTAPSEEIDAINNGNVFVEKHQLLQDYLFHKGRELSFLAIALERFYGAAACNGLWEKEPNKSWGRRLLRKMKFFSRRSGDKQL